MNALTKALIREGVNISIDKPTEYLVDKLLKKKGQLARIKYIRPLHVRQGFHNAYAFKTTDGVFRVGISYDNTSVVISGRESGALPPTNQGLIGRSWIIPNYFLIGKDNKILVRLYTVKNAFKQVKYELNNHEVTEEVLKQVCLASEFSDDHPICFDVELEYIAEVT